jgi:hypothetical protein
MQDIRLVDNDGEYLNLETQGGEKFRLVLDDSLRSAIKRESPINLDNLNISPREIQDEVRAGSTAEEVAAKHDVPLDYVEKFSLTVEDEIGHVIASAKTVRISVEADRYSEATQIEFAEVLEGRLRKANAINLTWKATKHEGSPWIVALSYDLSEGPASALWSFDQRRLVLSPENETAIKLSAGDFAAAVSAPKLREVELVEEPTRVIDLPRTEELKPETQVSIPSIVPPSAIEELTRSSLLAVQEPSEEVVEQELSPTADLLEALRRKRASSASAPVEESDEVLDVQSVEDVEDEIKAAPVVPASKKSRPSMPSWDEIVFGTKTED